MEKNEGKQEVMKIKNEVLEIISKKTSGISCLCGHSEWCDACSALSNFNELVTELRKYLSGI